MTPSDASLKGKIRAMAKKGGLKPQELLQMYLFEHLLLRLEKSPYADKFILKGGLLVSSMTGVMQRTTMDMDTTVVGMDMDESTVTAVVGEICLIDVNDEMNYIFERVEPIREIDEYANWRAHLRVRYGKLDAPIKIDITTGDRIVPGQTVYAYPLMFDGGWVRVLSYPIETVLAEKFETVVSRGVTNTRGRDLYDIHALLRTRRDVINEETLAMAVAATAEKRGSTDAIAHYVEILEEVRLSHAMRDLVWASYVKSAPYVGNLGFDAVVDAAIELGDLANRGRKP